MLTIRTDLAMESHQLWRETAGEAATLPGVNVWEEVVEPDRHDANVRAVKEILDEKGDEFYLPTDSVAQIRILTEDIDETGQRAKVTLETVCHGGRRDTTVHDLVKTGAEWKFIEVK